MTVNRQPSMERYQVILAYDGSRYKGFQRQAKARSVQDIVEVALRKLGWQGKSPAWPGTHGIFQCVMVSADRTVSGTSRNSSTGTACTRSSIPHFAG